MTGSITYIPQGNQQPLYYVVQPEKKSNKPTLLQSGVGVAGGYAACKGFSRVHGIYSRNLMNKITSLTKGMTENQIKEFVTANDKLYIKSGLNKKGVKFIDANTTNFENFYETLLKRINDFNKLKLNKKDVEDMIKNKNNMPKNKVLGKVLIKIIDKVNKYIYNSIKFIFLEVKNGRNAFFHGAANVIVKNDKSPMVVALPHEMGHALNLHDGGIKKCIQLVGVLGVKVAPITILLTSLLKNKKQEGEQTTGIFDKITTFIKDNCGKLTFISIVPLLYEEAMASIRGTKLSKEFLSQENFKILTKFNAMAWTTYLSAAVVASLGIKLASTVTDSVKEHFRNKNNKEIQKGQIA